MEKIKTENELMLEYIKRFYPLCIEVVSYKIPEWPGLSGPERFLNYYEVESIFKTPDTSLPIENYLLKKKVVLKIKRKSFDIWKEEQNSIEIISEEII